MDEFVKTVNAFVKASAQRDRAAANIHRAKALDLKSAMGPQELLKAERIEAILGAYHQ